MPTLFTPYFDTPQRFTRYHLGRVLDDPHLARAPNTTIGHRLHLNQRSRRHFFWERWRAPHIKLSQFFSLFENFFDLSFYFSEHRSIPLAGLTHTQTKAHSLQHAQPIFTPYIKPRLSNAATLAKRLPSLHY